MNAEIIKIDRETAIAELTASMFDSMSQDEYYMEQVIEHGFKGFYNYTDEELIQEYKDYISMDPTYPVIIQLEEITQ